MGQDLRGGAGDEIVVLDVAQVEIAGGDLNPVVAYLSGLRSEHSRRNLRRHLDKIAVLLAGDDAVDALAIPWQALRKAHTQALAARLADEYAPATVNAMLSALRGVLKACFELELMSAEDYQRAAAVKTVKGSRLPAGRDVKFAERRALYEQCNLDRPDEQTLKDKRDAAILAVLTATGMRRAEVAALTVADYSRDNGQLRTMGKGDKERTVYVKKRHKQILDDWLDARGGHEGAIFHPIAKGDKLNPERGITPQAVYNMLKYRAEKAGIAEFSPHDLRRTFVGDALDAGVDLVTVADIAGHESTDTTRRYDRRDERRKEEAAGRIGL